MADSKPRVLVPLGNGFEELEAIAVVDVLRRAGAQVITASVGAANPIVGRNRIRVMADLDLSDALTEWETDWDLVFLPGGLGGVEAIEADETLMGLLEARLAARQPVAAICAGPRALKKAGLDPATPLTSHPSIRSELSQFANYLDAAVVRADHVLTSRGPGTAVAMGLACVELLFGAERAEEIREQIVA